MMRTQGGRVYPYPAAVAQDDRLTADDRLVWQALALFCDERGRSWTLGSEENPPRTRPTARTTYRVLAERLGWRAGDGLDAARVRRAIAHLVEHGLVEDLNAGRYRLTWIADNAATLVNDGVWAAKRGGWADIGTALGDWSLPEQSR